MIDKSQLRIRPGCLLVLFLVAVILLLLVLNGDRQHTRAKIIATHLYERPMAMLLQEAAQDAGGLTNINDEFIHRACTATNKDALLMIIRTNGAGELLDCWLMPFQITLIGPTNFSIRSAGPDKHLGNRDDIVFNTVSNDFMNP